MKQMVEKAVAELENQLAAFAQDLVRIKSRTGREGNLAARAGQEMEKLGYDNIIADKTGNIIGVIGNGPVKLLFDSHIDHVAVNDAAEWSHGPYSGDIEDGKLYGPASGASVHRTDQNRKQLCLYECDTRELYNLCRPAHLPE